MSKPFGQKSMSVLHWLNTRGDKALLELEREIGTAQLDTAISHLRQGGYVKSLSKERGMPMRYAITNDGRGVIGAHLQKQESLRNRPIHELPLYVPKDTPVRPGSMRAYQLPSGGM